MKEIILIVSVLVISFLAIKCTKDAIEQPKAITQDFNIKYLYPEDFAIDSTGARDGVELPFSFPFSGVEYDIFNNNTLAYNLTKVDSFVYEKAANQTYGYAGYLWHQYKTTIYLKDTVLTKLLFARRLVDRYVIIPTLEFNQLDPTNPNRWMQVVTTKRGQVYFDMKCGKTKRRFYYDVYAEDTPVANVPIDGNRCNSNLFNYDLIIE